MKKVLMLIMFTLSLFVTLPARADVLGCGGGAVVGGGFMYGLGTLISDKAAIVLGGLGVLGGCSAGSRMEDGTYGKPNTQAADAQVVAPTQVNPAYAYETPLVRAARVQARYNKYRREEVRQAAAAYCEEDEEGCARAVSRMNSYPGSGERLFGPTGSVLRTPY